MMSVCKIPRIIIAAAHSGSGKTTITMGIIAALKKQGFKVQAYKIGPDYIDPGYHKIASGKIVHNLDTWLLSETELEDFFINSSQNSDIAIVEGVMGLYDGGKNGISSTAEIAKKLKATVVLVLDVKSMGDSAAAIALGFKNYDPSVNIGGVILNRVGSLSHETIIRHAMEKIKIPVLGAIYRDAGLVIPERHLGLVPTTENEIGKIVDKIASFVQDRIDLPQMIDLAKQSLPLSTSHPEPKFLEDSYEVTIGVACDEAFSFYYEESLKVLETLGAKIVYFSPLQDSQIPEVDGLIFGGGFPEMFAQQLANNQKMKQSIQAASKSGMPIYAECGGFMYLTASLCDFSNEIHPMVNIIPARCKLNTKLQTVGYVEAKSLNDNILANKGDLLRGHEFHFSSTEPIDGNFAWAFEMKKVRTGIQYKAGYAKDNILASYLHLHFIGNRQFAKKFVLQCKEFASKS